MGTDLLDPVIHQQTRLQILAALYRNRRASFTDLRDGLSLTAGNLASHVTRLEEAGYLRGERALTATGFDAQYVITADGIEAFEAYLARLRGLLEAVDAPADGLRDKLPEPRTVPDPS